MAEKSGLSSRTLRHYEAIGLLPPTGRSEGGYRVYTEEDLHRLMTIRRMKALDYSTTEMGRLLELLDIAESDAPEAERADARAELEALREDARARRQKLARQMERADEFLGILDHRLGCTFLRPGCHA
ncbi:MerR family transcriptional regulator [Kocuria arenosa]|uniref:helix-turn-helix domain-containing protein n=1 Tax=Kocuria arenosa TaxID=3071446 RepID=UPI003F6792E8